MYRLVIVAALATLAVASCEKKAADKPADKPAEPAAPVVQDTRSPLEIARENSKIFVPLPAGYAKADQTKEQEDLGRQLYFDARLSKNHDISCDSCHKLDKFGVDGEPTSPGHKKARGARNSPTVYNAAGHMAQFWDGREPDVEAQAKGPVLNPVEMAMPSQEATVAVLKSIPGYAEPFKKAFPKDEDPVTFDNMATAIGRFERKLVTPGKWDKFLGGDDKALTDEELTGFNTFISTGCVACHAGPLLGANMYQKLGVVAAWPSQKDQGRFDVTKNEADKMMFKVPSLRDVTKTGPYFHDGSEKDLIKAVQMMGKHQLGKEIGDPDAKSIVAWLDALTGELPAEYIKKPELPESGPDTPKPDPT